MAKILVTGATGFLGKRVCEVLEGAGHEVYGTTKSRPSDRIFYCNIEDADGVAALFNQVQPKIVIHCAAISSVTSSTTNEYYLSNTLGTENIVNVISKFDFRCRLIFISTAGVYGNQGVEYLSEKLCPKPVHHYGMSKFCCERVIMNFADSIDYTIVRPFNIIGESQSGDFIVPKLARAFASRQPVLRLGNLDVYRDYLDIQEAGEAIAHMAFTDDAIGETYNLCSGYGTSLNELIELFKSFTGHDIVIEQAPEFTRKNEVWRLIGDATKLRDLIGEQIDPIPVSASIQRIVTFEERRLASQQA